MRRLIAGNWKMNGLRASLAEIAAIAQSLADAPLRADVLICPPFTLIGGAVAAAEGRVGIGAQDCHPDASGAFTGDVSAEMLADLGATSVIVGHSECRSHHGDTDATVAAKVTAAWRARLVPILCVGETESDHNAGRAAETVANQLEGSLPAGASASNISVAYEPVWAIGSGRTPTLGEIAAMHGLIRAQLGRMLGEPGRAVRVLYGGSVKPANAAAILAVPEVNGVLVGGASLASHDFLQIARAILRSD